MDYREQKNNSTGSTVVSESVAESSITAPSAFTCSVCENTGWPAIPGRGDEEHALVAVETAVRHEDAGVGIESDKIACSRHEWPNVILPVVR